MDGSPVAVALAIADALESCGVRYVVGGSLASSISVVGILLVQGDALDRGYLQRGAETLGVVDLLTRAVAHARP